MKHVKSILTLILTLLFISQAAVMAAAAAEIQHPRLVVYGQVSKPVYVGRSIFEYKDDQGLSSTLPFERQDENISINFANIFFEQNFPNLTYTAEEVSSQIALTADYLSPSNQPPYFYLHITNDTALEANQKYGAQIILNCDKSINNDYYMIATVCVKKLAGDNLAKSFLRVKYFFKDVSATERTLSLQFRADSAVTGTPQLVNNAYYFGGNMYGVQIGSIDSIWYTMQFRIADLLSALSLDYELVKLTKILLIISYETSDTVDAESTIEAKIVLANIFASKIYIDDPFYTNSLIVNGTVGQFTPTAGDIIQIYGANATKIACVTIPWQVEVTPEIDKDPDNLRMQYTWEWTMPKSPSEVGDTLTFSNTNMTLYGYKDGDAWNKLYLNGVDKLSSIASLKVPSDADYWTYALATSLSEGNMYQVIGRVQYTAEEYDSLTAAPLFWENPVAWLIYKFWSLVIAVAAFFGLSVTFAVKQRRKAQIPKVK